MNENKFSLINMGDVSKVGQLLIEKVSDAVGGIAKPWQIKRIANAEAEAAKIKALVGIEIQEIQQRALIRFLNEETKKQINIESIAEKAIPQLKDNSRPQDIENDWITNYFDKCRLISDEEMQQLWSRILAGEANNPGTFSKRTVSCVSAFDKSDAMLFTKFCSFVWGINNNFLPLIYRENEYTTITDGGIYEKNGLTFDSLQHLDDIGLVTRDDYMTTFIESNLPETTKASYYDRQITLKFKQKENNDLEIGQVLFTKIGKELVSISGAKPIPEFYDFILKKWSDKEFTGQRSNMDFTIVLD